MRVELQYRSLGCRHNCKPKKSQIFSQISPLTHSTAHSTAMIKRQVARQSRLLAVRFNSTSSVSKPEEATLPKPKNVSQLEGVDRSTEKQAPNRTETWAPSQRPRADALDNVRFVQRDLDLQPRPYAAIDLIAKEPIRYLDSSVAVCDGAAGVNGPQGHPKVYINLDKPGSHACQYCKLL